MTIEIHGEYSGIIIDSLDEPIVRCSSLISFISGMKKI
jgi:hypothetical protein